MALQLMVPWKNEDKRRKKTLKKINKKKPPHLHLHFVPNRPKERNEMKEKKIPQKNIKKELNSTSGLLLINQEITIKIETKA